MYKTVVIFGGCGYIGKYFAREIIKRYAPEKIYLADIVGYQKETLHAFFNDSEMRVIEGVYCDVRNNIELAIASVDLIGNFAAVHREPGHDDWEYFDTNTKGAENVTAWAEKVQCNQILFTSSIATYGPTEELKSEKSLQVPVSAYGASKLVAEKIHQLWLQGSRQTKRLTIVRPGVVFGPGEKGNVTRLVRAVLKHYFFYMGNKKTKKASIYIKELCASMIWTIERQIKAEESLVIYNAVMPEVPTIEDFVNAIQSNQKNKFYVIEIPYHLLYLASYIVSAIFGLVGVSQPINPVRVKKLKKSNNVLPEYLMQNHYPFKFSMSDVMLDWKKDNPEEWQ